MNQDIANLYSSKDTKTKLSITYNKIRSQTKLLAERLTLEDQCVQSMPNASPTKWHLAHTTWFFETFILLIFFTGDLAEQEDALNVEKSCFPSKILAPFLSR